MNRRLFRKWARWLLPLLVARAFLPVGFMLAADAGGMELAFCPGQAPFVEIFGAASAADHSADASAAGAHHHQGGRIDPPCPFAVAALAAAIGVPHLDAASLRTVDRVVPDQTVSVPLAGPERVERIRGPPSLS